MIKVVSGKFKFCLERYTVTKRQYDAVRLWALQHGYHDLSTGRGEGPNKPVGLVDWYDAVKFCNALSELAGLRPVYYTDEAFTQVYRSGRLDAPYFNLKANGYRLPFQDEWEFACRAGSTGKFFWDETEQKCEYAWSFDASVHDLVPRDVGLLKPNKLGFYDMCGNVREWCSDIIGCFRATRGGSVALDSNVECGHSAITLPTYKLYETGFRVASSNLNAKSVQEVAVKSEFYGKYVEPELKYNDMSENGVAARLLPLLKDGEVKKLLQEGKISEGLRKFSEECMSLWKTFDLSEFFRRGTCETPLDKLMSIRAPIVWFGEGQSFHPNTESLRLLIEEWDKTKDERYLNQYIFLMTSFFSEEKAAYDMLTDSQLSTTVKINQSWAWNNGYEVPRRAIAIMGALGELARLDAPLPPKFVAGAVVSLATDHLSGMLIDDRACVQNQLIHGATALVVLGGMLRMLRNSEQWQAIGISRWEKAIENCIFPDGSAMEQSFMYNEKANQEFTNTAEFVADKSLLKKLYKSVDYLTRMLRAVCLPTGDVPALATSGSQYPPAIYADSELMKDYKWWNKSVHTRKYKNFPWKEWDRIVEKLWGTGNSEEPSFTSINFPYGGITILRDKWSIEGKYLFFFAPRAASGHAVENINSIDVCAYGRYLLASVGASSYHIKDFVDPDQYDIIDGIQYYQKRSFGRNTVVVDGQSQRRLICGENRVTTIYKDTIGNRFFDNGVFSYTEGFYNDGYGNEKDINISARHDRRIIFDKKSGLFFVVDIMCAAGCHTYTQIWNFLPKFKTGNYTNHYNKEDNKMQPNVNEKEFRKWIAAGFDDDQIIIDGQKVYTNDKDAPNVFLYHFGQQMAYRRYRGHKDPYYGWLAPKIADRRYEKTDIHASWSSDKEKSILLTVIELTKSHNSDIKQMKDISDKNQVGCEITMATNEVINFRCLENGDMQLLRGDDSITINESDPHAICDGVRQEIYAPRGFMWEERDGRSIPKYL